MLQACALAMALADASAVQAAPVEDGLAHFLGERGLGEPANEPAGFVAHMQDRASGMVIAAMNFLGVRYRRGGSSADEGFDCSGFTRHVFEHSLGLVLPRRVDEQAGAAQLQAVRRDDLAPGDLVFFNTLKRTFSHVGIYVGDGKFIHAPRSGARVRMEDMRTAYWAKRYTGGRRAAVAEQAAAPATPAPAAGPTLSTGAAERPQL